MKKLIASILLILGCQTNDTIAMCEAFCRAQGADLLYLGAGACLCQVPQGFIIRKAACIEWNKKSVFAAETLEKCEADFQSDMREFCLDNPRDYDCKKKSRGSP